MSYDIHLVHREPGQSWADALDALAEATDANGGPQPIPADTRQLWDRLAGELQGRWPELERFDGPDLVELTDPETGMQISFFRHEMAVSVPYWHGDDDTAAAIMADLRTIAVFLEDETDYEAYDPQLDRGVREAELSEASALLGGLSARLPDLLSGGRAADEPAPPPRKRRRFWRR